MPASQEDTGKQPGPAVDAHTAGQSRANTSNPVAGGWSKPKKSSQAPVPPQSTPVVVENRFSMLNEEGELMKEEGPGPEPGPPRPSRARTRRKKKKNPPAEEDKEEVKGPR